MSFTTATNFALTNISHGETEGMVKCTHLLMYVQNALVELGYHVPDHLLVAGDNSASINWTEGGATSGLSRHFCQRIMAIQDYAAKGIVEYKHVCFPTSPDAVDLCWACPSSQRSPPS